MVSREVTISNFFSRWRENQSRDALTREAVFM